MTFTPTIAPMYDDNEPNENSTLDELGAYALVKQTRIIANDKRNGEDLWLMGQALVWAKKQKPHGGFEKWFKSQGLTKTYVWQARTLHDKATLEEVRELGSTEALRKFDVVAEKKAKPEPATVTTVTVEKVEDTNPTPDSNVEATEPTDEVDGSDQAESNDEVAEDPTDALAEEDAKEQKERQNALRHKTPKTRAVAILHALELLRDELKAEEFDEELQNTFGQIAELAEELKGLNKPFDAAAAA